MIKKGQLIVSCQALEDEPLHSPFIMAKMAKAAKEGGASAIRANSIVDIKAIKNEIDLPIIGIIKKQYDDSKIHITASLKEVDELYNIGVDIIATDATSRMRPGNISLEQFYNEIKNKYPNQLLMADCSTIDEMVNAQRLGFDYVATTLFGYTEYSKIPAMANEGALMKQACSLLSVPIIAEGNINAPQVAVDSLRIGCHAVVVGSMITRPQIITRAFLNAITNNC